MPPEQSTVEGAKGKINWKSHGAIYRLFASFIAAHPGVKFDYQGKYS